jgi:hypothetical protein
MPNCPSVSVSNDVFLAFIMLGSEVYHLLVGRGSVVTTTDTSVQTLQDHHRFTVPGWYPWEYVAQIIIHER